MESSVYVTQHLKKNHGGCLLLSSIIFLLCLLEYWMMPKWSQMLLEALVEYQAGNHTVLLQAIAGLVGTALLLAILGIGCSWCSVSYRKKVTLHFEQILVEKCCRLESFGADNRLSLLRQTQKDGKMILAVAHREAFLKAAGRMFLVADGTVSEVVQQ